MRRLYNGGIKILLQYFSSLKRSLDGEFGRVRAIMLFTLCLFVILFTRVATIPILSTKVKTDYVTNFGKTTSSICKRHDIIDRNGEVLARSLIGGTLYLDTRKVADVVEELNKLRTVLPAIANKIDKIITKYQEGELDSAYDSSGISQKELEKKMILIDKRLPPWERQRIIEAGVVGVYFDDESTDRVYPYKNVTSHILGLVSVDGTGIAGLEYQMNSKLTDSSEKPVQLSIDVRIQSIVRNVLARAVNRYNAKGGFGIIMKVDTGELISAVSIPDFNPNNISFYENGAMFNRFSLGVYELGSVFKIFLAVLALENGISLTKKYKINDKYNVSEYFITDFREANKGREMNLSEILQYSSNVGCALVMEDIPISMQRNLFLRLGFDDAVGLELPEKGVPRLPPPAHKDGTWSKTYAVTATYGYGVAVTPIHFVKAVNALVNDGKMIEPTLLKVNNYKDIKYLGQISSPAISMNLKKILKLVVEQGSGRKGIAENYSVGGKSGTAMRIKRKKYVRDNVFVSFVSIVPAEKPEYIFYFGIEEPSIKVVNERNATGGGVVAPLVGEIIKLTGPMLNISTSSTVK